MRWAELARTPPNATSALPPYLWASMCNCRLNKKCSASGLYEGVALPAFAKDSRQWKEAVMSSHSQTPQTQHQPSAFCCIRTHTHHMCARDTQQHRHGACAQRVHCIQQTRLLRPDDQDKMQAAHLLPQRVHVLAQLCLNLGSLSVRLMTLLARRQLATPTPGGQRWALLLPLLLLHMLLVRLRRVALWALQAPAAPGTRIDCSYLKCTCTPSNGAHTCRRCYTHTLLSR